ncbi:MAG: diguanylate cyclase, partial [Bacillus sp. (in: Bacteria)]|nr:diguanylate cyclase [Bacillus sp. (in: firmicutes)]
LTGIANRRLFDEFFAREWQSAIRLQQPLSILLIDLDYFKNVNDFSVALHPFLMVGCW